MTITTGAAGAVAAAKVEETNGRAYGEYSPARIVEELDRYIIGQSKAKRKVALALRNRVRRKQVEPPLRDEIVPKNILMIGPTGVGKTEIARRLAKLSGSPFLKVEATKFTEVGYVGRDVDSIIRDLTDVAYEMVKAEHRLTVQARALKAAEERVAQALAGEDAEPSAVARFRARLRKGLLENKEVEIELEDQPGGGAGFSSYEFPQSGTQVGVLNIGELISKAVGRGSGMRRMTVAEARKLLTAEETDNLLDNDRIALEATERAMQDGVVFLDEIDKITSRSEARSNGEISREGVQRDLLPLLEGTTVKTPYGSVSTAHILFIASGAFHLSSPSDLLPELQGRLPIRVELDPLSVDDLARILTEPEHSLIRQYKALLAVEGVDLRFTEDGVRAMAVAAAEVNANVENIGARRLQTIAETLLEDVSFSPERYKAAPLVVDAAFVEAHIGAVTRDVDLSRFIL